VAVSIVAVTTITLSHGNGYEIPIKAIAYRHDARGNADSQATKHKTYQ